MLMNIEDENLHISISDKNFSETILEEFDYIYTDEGCLIDLFGVTLNIIEDAKFDLFKDLIGGDVPESLQTDEYMDFIFKVFKIERVKEEIMEEKKLSEFLKEKGAYESFIENCLNTEDTLQSIIDYNLSNIGIKNGFIWGFTPQGFVYWSKLHSEISKLNITNDMDEILYKEYEKRNMIESSEQNPTTSNIVENDAETTKQEYQIITLGGVDYYLVPKKEAPLLTLNDLRDIGLSDEDLIANGYSEEDLRKEPREKHLKRKFEQGNGQYEVLFKEKKSNEWSFCYSPNDLTWRKDFDYKLIKKEHKEIVEAYLKDNSIKIQFRWYVEDWEILDNLIENYDEDFCYRIAKKEFEPFTLNIEVKTLDEAKSLWNRFNLNYNTLCRALCNLYNVEFENRISTHKYWTQIDDILKDFGEVPDVKP